MDIFICDQCGKIKEDHYTLSDGMFCDCPMPSGGPVPRVRLFTLQDALNLKAKVERLQEENAQLRAWREIGFALWHAASPDSDDEIGREALSRFLLAVDKQLETEAAAAAKGEADAPNAR